MKTITVSRLKQLMESTGTTVIDVRLSDDFAAGHLPNSINNCVFEVSFHDRLGETAADPGQPIVVYGAHAQSHEARMAAEKLLRKGYADVAELEGGIEAWERAGHAIERSSPLPAPPSAPDGRLDLDLDECRLEWLGRNLLNRHHGTIEITSGHLDFEQGSLKGGECHFDLQSLKCTDLDGTPGHDVLIQHLQDHDFLDVAEHPECQLVITRTTPIPDSGPGAPNLHVTADLTMRGVTEPIEFTAASGLTPEGQPAAQASFAIDRTRWGILYGSGRFFERLAGHLVNDQIDFQVRIVAKTSS